MIFFMHVVLKFFSNFPNACKIELRALREAGTFITVDSESACTQLTLTILSQVSDWYNKKVKVDKVNTYW